MVQRRTRSMELHAIREQLSETPPPPAAGAGIRTWLAGLALSNPVLMADVAAAERVAEAIRLADELVAALAAPKVPVERTISAPGAAAMNTWERALAEKDRVTERPGRLRRTGDAIAPPSMASATQHFRSATAHLERASQYPPPVQTEAPEPGSGAYSIVDDELVDVED